MPYISCAVLNCPATAELVVAYHENVVHGFQLPKGWTCANMHRYLSRTEYWRFEYRCPRHEYKGGIPAADNLGD